MEKRISYSEFQSVKSVAKSCDPMITKRNKLKAKIEELAKEYKSCDDYISTLEAGVVKIIGFRVEQLVKKVIEPGVDTNGQPKKTTKYLPTDMVSYDEQHKQYVINIPDDNTEEESKSFSESEETASTSEEDNMETSTEMSNTDTEVNHEDTQVVETENVPTDAPIFE